MVHVEWFIVWLRVWLVRLEFRQELLTNKFIEVSGIYGYLQFLIFKKADELHRISAQ